MDWHVAIFSGGKDSTAMLFLLLENGYPLDEVVFCNTGAEYPELLNHIEKVKQHLPPKICFTILKPEYDFFSYLLSPHKRGKYKGLPYGFPSPQKRWCVSFLKLKPMRLYEQYLKTEGKHPIKYIGLTKDEVHRARLDSNIRYPLIEFGVSSREALAYCYSLGFDWKGIYEYTKRLGCYPCPFASLNNLRYLFYHHPDLWERILKTEEYLKAKGYPFWKFKPSISAKELDKRFRAQLSLPF